MLARAARCRQRAEHRRAGRRRAQNCTRQIRHGRRVAGGWMRRSFICIYELFAASQIMLRTYVTDCRRGNVRRVCVWKDAMVAQAAHLDTRSNCGVTRAQRGVRSGVTEPIPTPERSRAPTSVVDAASPQPATPLSKRARTPPRCAPNARAAAPPPPAMASTARSAHVTC